METIERIRNATFTLARRGYDRREVDNYLAKLADWLEGGGADQVHSDTIKHELERIGSKTAKILTAAEEAGQSVRSDAEHDARQIREDAQIGIDSAKTAAEEHAKQVREDAQAFATKTRSEAEGHADRVRNEADAHAGKVVKEAEEKAIRMVEEGAKRRRDMEKVIADLETRRDAVIGGLEKLSNQLAGAATAGKGDAATSSSDRNSRAAQAPASGSQPTSSPSPSPAPSRQ